MLLEALEASGADHALMGGFAVLTWGIPRATYDADVLTAMSDEQVGAFMDACEKRGFEVDEVYRRGWRDSLRDMDLIKVRLFRGERSVTADVFLVTTPFQEIALRRAPEVGVPGLGRPVRVVTPADLILFKLMADRPKDRLDIQNIIAVQGIPEEEYLREWAPRLGVGDRLLRALEQQGSAGD